MARGPVDYVNKSVVTFIIILALSDHRTQSSLSTEINHGERIGILLTRCRIISVYYYRLNSILHTRQLSDTALTGNLSPNYENPSIT